MTTTTYAPLTVRIGGRTVTVTPVYRDAADSDLLRTAQTLAAETADQRADREASGHCRTATLRSMPAGSRFD